MINENKLYEVFSDKKLTNEEKEKEKKQIKFRVIKFLADHKGRFDFLNLEASVIELKLLFYSEKVLTNGSRNDMLYKIINRGIMPCKNSDCDRYIPKEMNWYCSPKCRSIADIKDKNK